MNEEENCARIAKEGEDSHTPDVYLVTSTVRRGSFLVLGIMRFVVGLLLLGQFHVCSQIFLHSDGSACSGEHVIHGGLAEHKVGGHHHDACSIKPCHDQKPDVLNASSAQRDIQFDAIALPAPIETTESAPTLPNQVISWLVEASPPTGPPLHRSTRAPPTFLQIA